MEGEYEQKLQLYVDIMNLSLSQLVGMKARLVLQDAFHRMKMNNTEEECFHGDNSDDEVESFVSFEPDILNTTHPVPKKAPHSLSRSM
jgi:hypothetical protein